MINQSTLLFHILKEITWDHYYNFVTHRKEGLDPEKDETGMRWMRLRNPPNVFRTGSEGKNILYPKFDLKLETQLNIIVLRYLVTQVFTVSCLSVLNSKSNCGSLNVNSFFIFITVWSSTWMLPFEGPKVITLT